MSITRPTGEQLSFVSSKTGTHVLDTYLEDAEKGSRELPDLLSDIWDSSGNLKPGYLDLQVTAAGVLQYRLAGVGAWIDLQPVFQHKGVWAGSTVYKRTDTVTESGVVYICVSDHTSDPTTFANDSARWVVAIPLAGNPVYFRGTFDAASGSYPGSPGRGDLYIASTAGAIGADVYDIGDMALYDGSAWEKIESNAGSGVQSTYVFTATGGETSISGTDDNGDTLSYTVGAVQVYLNGVRLIEDVDFTASDGASITGLTALSAGDTLVVDIYAAFSIADHWTKSEANARFVENADNFDAVIVSVPEVREYDFSLSIPADKRVQVVRFVCSSGTATVSLKHGSGPTTILSGLSVSSTAGENTSPSLVIPKGDRVFIDVTAVSSCENLEIWFGG